MGLNHDTILKKHNLSLEPNMVPHHWLLELMEPKMIPQRWPQEQVITIAPPNVKEKPSWHRRKYTFWRTNTRNGDIDPTDDVMGLNKNYQEPGGIQKKML